MAHDPDIEERMRAGGHLIAWGVAVLGLTLIGTCGAVLNSAGHANPATQGVDIGQSPWLLLALGVGINLLVMGNVRKSNARRDEKSRYLEAHTTIEVELDADAAGGPFRGDMKEVEVLDPHVAAAENAEREHAHRRGNTYLWIGGTMLAVTLGGIMLISGNDGGGNPRRAMERILMATGFAVFPFGAGLWLTIKGLLLRFK